MTRTPILSSKEAFSSLLRLEVRILLIVENKYLKSFQNVERAFFVLDVQNGIAHLFKNPNQDKPSESLSLSGGTLPAKTSTFILN